MSAPRLLIISFSTIRADARLLKQIARLRRDFAVHTVGYGDAPDGVSGHLQIPDEFPIWRYDRLAVLLRRYRHAYWSNPAIAAALSGLAGTQWDLVLANDVDAVGLALAQQSVHGVHADLHEYAPRQKEDVRRWRLFVAPFIRWMCRTFVVRADSVTTVGQGIAQEYERRYGIHAGVVTNAAPYADLEPTPVAAPIRLVHSGAALRDRNIVAIIDAAEATSADVRLSLYLTPNDPGFLEEVRARAEASARVELHDPVPYVELSRTLNAHDVGVHLLPPVNFNNTWALPNKFFDYVQARLGVIIGPSPEMARVLEEGGFGAVADGFDAPALTRLLDGLDAERVRAWKQASAASARDLSGEEQAERWADALAALLAAPSKRTRR
ncbi:glycosyltransferase [Microbacterium sp. LEMMJ01]|uniref:glycosyltransferase n=1 Tax=Microbacterium sp. LEMMJ01 TaxID=1978350 RepID=UPI000A1E4944|nr:glycosyltransferase [Microbacterium sp. LEMMJ01]OSO98558.1 glycosyltransferase [Microbacterium sp. LEMMJ01]